LGFGAVVVSFVTLWSCVGAKERSSSVESAVRLQLKSMNPSSTVAGQAFLPQPGGDSAIIITGTGFVPTSKVRFDDKILNTTFAGETGLTAIVTPELYAKEGSRQVTVQNPDGDGSNALVFRVYALSGGAPVLKKLVPSEAQAGLPFLPQPGGDSALIFEGDNFRPGVVAVFNGTKLNTTFAGPTGATALVPPELVRSPGTASVRVVNSDGSKSEAVKFIIRGAK
jgi:hypothetical protein